MSCAFEDEGLLPPDEFGANATIKVRLERQPFRTAPERVAVDVYGWSGFRTRKGPHPGYDARLHRIIYYVEFGEPDSCYAAPTHVLPEWRNRNKGFGPLTAHVYRAPGRYKIQVWAYEIDSDKRAYWEEVIEVEDPKQTFRNSEVYISANGDFSKAPRGIVGRYRSLAEAWRARQRFPVTRFVFKSGETHWDHPYTYLDMEQGGLRNAAHFVTDGTAPVTFVHDPNASKATFAFRICAGRKAPNPQAEMVFQNIHVQGNWDDVNERGQPKQTAWADFAGRYHLHHVLLDQCEARNCEFGYESTGEALDETHSVTLHDCVIERFRDLGIFGGGIARWNILGCRVARGTDAAAGGGKGGPPFHNIHGPIRLNAKNRNRVVIDGCDLFSRAGWYVNVKGWRTQQPCIRANQWASPGSVLNLQRTAMEGGYNLVSLGRMSNVVNSGIQNCLIDKCIMVGTHMTRAAVGADGGGITLRNSLFIVPNTPRIAKVFQSQAMLEITKPKGNDRVRRVPVELSHNTLLNHMTAASALEGDGRIALVADRAQMTDVHTANNLSIARGLEADPGLLSKDVLWTPRETGYRSKTVPDPQRQFATPDNSVQLAAPLDAPQIIGNAMEEPQSFFDLRGYKRPALPSIGAMERPET